MTERDKLVAKIKADLEAGLMQFVNQPKPSREEVTKRIDEVLKGYIQDLTGGISNPSEQLARPGRGSEVVVNVRAMASMLYWYESNEQTRAELMFKKMYGEENFTNVDAIGFSEEGDWEVRFKHHVEYFLVTLETKDGKVKVVNNEEEC